MIGRGTTAWLVCSVALAITLGFEVQRFLNEPEPVLQGATVVAATGAVTAIARAPTPPLGAVLSRPLFTRGRRAEVPLEPAVAEAPGLPRLAGVLVNGSDRSAILVPANGGPAVVAREGMAVNGMAVRRIQAGEVTLAAPGGDRVLRISFDRRRAAAPQTQGNTTGTTAPQAQPVFEPPAMGPPGGLAR